MRLAPLAAHQAAAVHAARRDVTLPAVRPERARLGVRLAEVVRVLRVHQVPLGRQLDRRIVRHEAVPIVPRNYLGCAVKVFLQPGAHLRERGQFHPAGFGRAGPGQPVTFALHAHELLDGLVEQKFGTNKRRNYSSK